jgi:hypothetical protein
MNEDAPLVYRRPRPLASPIGVRLPAPVRQAAERLAMSRNMSLSQLAREAIMAAVQQAAPGAR